MSVVKMVNIWNSEKNNVVDVVAAVSLLCGQLLDYLRCF